MTHEQEIALETTGLPPAKSEAKSLLAADHPHAVRVRALLQAARAATDRPEWVLLEGEVGLEVVVRGPQDRWRGDATNVLGGIGDVLQRKQHRPRVVDLSHLGALADVALYHDDRQIRQVRTGRNARPRPPTSSGSGRCHPSARNSSTPRGQA